MSAIQHPLEQTPIAVTAEEFDWFSGFLRRTTGIELKPGKESLVMGRLDRRVRHHGVTSYGDYFRLIGSGADRQETRLVIDLMTTNETYFFREAPHFDLLRTLAKELARPGRPLRVWSAASSSGEESSSIALVLHDHLTSVDWEVVGTDLSSRMVATARRGLYPLDAAHGIPEDLRKRYCLRGHGDFDGWFALQPELRERQHFVIANLTRDLPDLGGLFDIVFLRNVMIYFAADTKREVLRQVVDLIRPGGYLLIGHAESLTGLNVPGLRMVRPSVYERTPS